jgi:molybdopterin-guanine dinucleotide biosynthesis protein
MRHTIVSISGLSSDTGKTSLICDLLASNPGWEAIKVTRGHYRSCGKDPHACCVSHLLSDKPLVLSGYDQTYKSGKDTGRFWDSGAKNVHWVIATSDQVEAGIKIALDRVNTPGVLIEGNTFLKYIDADYSIMVARPPFESVKSSARSVLGKMDALYLSFCEPDETTVAELMSKLNRNNLTFDNIPVFSERDRHTLIGGVGSLRHLTQ